MEASLNLHLIITGSLAAVGMLFGGYLSAWLLQLYHHRRLLNHDRFMRHYERFASEKAYAFLLKMSPAGLPETYKDYKTFHNWNRRFAYLYFIRHLLIIAGLSLTVLFVFGAIPATFSRAYHLLYLAFPTAVTLHLLYAAAVRRRGRRFYQVLTMGSVLKKLNPSAGG
ncbi:hypothetical protein F4X86_00135 [Candidatus Saccharibacteria bacterium]|nr:hypothetical protein [Candidatus Saccharibacteria bacterium]